MVGSPHKLHTFIDSSSSSESSTPSNNSKLQKVPKVLTRSSSSSSKSYSSSKSRSDISLDSTPQSSVMTEATFRYQKARIVVLEEECLRAKEAMKAAEKERKVATGNLSTMKAEKSKLERKYEHCRSLYEKQKEENLPARVEPKALNYIVSVRPWGEICATGPEPGVWFIFDGRDSIELRMRDAARARKRQNSNSSSN